MLPHHFFTQARRGQDNIGAAAVVILDDMCVCTHADCNTTASVCAPHEPLLVNDGSTSNNADGSDIVIPTVMIYKTSADQLRNLIQDKNQALLMELAFGRGNEEKPAAPANNDTTCEVTPIAYYSLWTTPIDPVSVQLFGSFPKVMAELQKQITEDDYGDDLIASIIQFYSSHPYLIQGNDAHTSDNDNDNKENKDGYWNCPTNAACAHLCTNNGRYCTTPTRASTLHGISTVQVVKESLRRACIWKIYQTVGSSESSTTPTVEQMIQRATGHTWWSYVAAFTESCFTVDQAKGLDVPTKSGGDDSNTTMPSRFADETCIEQAYTAANIDAHLINDCMTDSGAIYVNDDTHTQETGNSLLDAEALTQKRHGIHYHPTAIVNDQPLAVQAHDAVVSTRTLFRALCSAMQQRSGGIAALPPLCFNCQWCHDIVGCMQHGGSCDEAWKQQRASDKKRHDDEHKKHDHDHDEHPNKPRSEGLVHHFFKVLFIMAVIGMFSYGGWHYYQTRRNGGGGGRNPFGGGGSFLGNYIPLSSGNGGDGASGLLANAMRGGGGGDDMGEGGTVQFLSG